MDEGELSEAELLDRDGHPLTGADVTVGFIRPAAAGADQAYQLTEVGGGHYRADAALRLPGIWDLRLIARHPAGTWQMIERVKVNG